MKKTSARTSGAKKKQAAGKSSKPAAKPSAAKKRSVSATKTSTVVDAPKKPKAAPRNERSGGRGETAATPAPRTQAAKTSDAKADRDVVIRKTPEPVKMPTTTISLRAQATAAKPRADMPPEAGYSLMVDGHYKSMHDSKAAATADGQALKKRFPFLRIEIFDAAKKARIKLD